MLTDTIYEHFKEIYNARLPQLETATTIQSDNTISEAINKISESGSYDVYCMDGNSVLATNIRELLSGKNITSMKITPYLYPVPTLSPTDTINKAANIMAHYRIRSAPVVQDGQIAGIVSAKSILRQILTKDNKWITANILFTQNPITLRSKDSLSAARKIMTSKRIDHIPIVHKDTVRQVLTSFHLLQAFNPKERLGKKSIGLEKIRSLESPIGNIGSTRVPQCAPKDNLNTILDSMLKTDTTCCLVTLWNDLHGIITYRDILSLLAAKIESEIPLYIVGMPEEESKADIITSKFTKALKRIRMVYSEIQEARASIKQQRAQGNRQYYEVTIRITTPYKTFHHKETGWDLSQIFDILSQKLLRNLSKRAKRRFKTSIRKTKLPVSPI